MAGIGVAIASQYSPNYMRWVMRVFKKSRLHSRAAFVVIRRSGSDRGWGCQGSTSMVK